MKRVVYMLCGVIASGKSTWAKRNMDENKRIVDKDVLRLGLYGGYGYKEEDEFMLHMISVEMCKQILLSGYDVIADFGEYFLRFLQRQCFRQTIYTCYPCVDFITVKFPVNPKAVEERRRNPPISGFPCTHDVDWEEIYNHQMKIYQPPTAAETEKYLYINTSGINLRHEFTP